MSRKILTRLTAAHPLAQTTVPAVASFPGAPSPSASFDWRQRAIDYDSFVYNWSQPGRFPTIAWDHTHYNMRDDTYKMPSYYGDSRLDADGTQEAIGQIARSRVSTVSSTAWPTRRSESLVSSERMVSGRSSGRRSRTG